MTIPLTSVWKLLVRLTWHLQLIRIDTRPRMRVQSSSALRNREHLYSIGPRYYIHRYCYRNSRKTNPPALIIAQRAIIQYMCSHESRFSLDWHLPCPILKRDLSRASSSPTRCFRGQWRGGRWRGWRGETPRGDTLRREIRESEFIVIAL